MKTDRANWTNGEWETFELGKKEARQQLFLLLQKALAERKELLQCRMNDKSEEDEVRFQFYARINELKFVEKFLDKEVKKK